jgi:hypothetical protein
MVTIQCWGVQQFDNELFINFVKKNCRGCSDLFDESMMFNGNTSSTLKVSNSQSEWQLPLMGMVCIYTYVA